jgi:hypothetical protein
VPALRDNLLPPPRLFFPRKSREPDSAERVHRLCDAAIWRAASPFGGLRFAVLALLWPLLAAFAAMPWLRRNGKTVKGLTGKGYGRQISEIVGLAVNHRIGPKYYYVFEFYLDEQRAQARHYLMRYETKQTAYRLLRPKVATSGTPIKNKIAFARYCRDHDLPAVPIFMTFRDGRRDDPAVENLGGENRGGGNEARGGGSLPKIDLFAKHVLGKGGVGAERWNWAGAGRYRSTKGEEKDEPTLLEHFARLSRDEPYLIQPALVNHPGLRDLSVGALCTVRMMTCRNEHGRHEVTDAAFRMSSNRKSAVDNLHAGGIAAAVDLKTGRLSRASDLGLGPDFVWHDRHPVSGGVITDRMMPFWEDALALAARAHDAFSEWAVVGWDIAILADGPCRIEGNKGPDLDIIQRTRRGPIGNRRFGELLAHNLERRIGGLH